MEDKENCGLDKLKKAYLELQEKLNLPSFDNLNEDFSIERLADLETDFLLREIRHLILEKIANYMRFLESVINPANASLFVFSFLKTLDSEKKKVLEESFKKIMKLEMSSIELDLKYSEEKETLFINDVYKIWKEVQGDLLQVLDHANQNWDKKLDNGSKGYFN